MTGNGALSEPIGATTTLQAILTLKEALQRTIFPCAISSDLPRLLIGSRSTRYLAVEKRPR
jgi:hypothetical protein